MATRRGFSFPGRDLSDRAVIFIDGNNWYHATKESGVQDLLRLDYSKIATKLVGPRDWIGTRYYIGRVRQSGNAQLYAGQRRFLSSFKNANVLHSVHLGRLEPRPVVDSAATELRRYLGQLTTRIDHHVYHDLMAICRNRQTTVMVEKAVDVMLAVDMVVMAERDEFDAAYLLSADGDFTPAVQAVRSHSKKVYAASCSRGAQLAAAVNSFIPLDRLWFDSCYR